MFNYKMKKVPENSDLKESLLWLGSITKDSLERLDNRFDELLGSSKQDDVPRDSITNGFEALMYKRAQILFPGRQIKRNVILTRSYLNKGGSVKQLQIGKIHILITEPNIIIEASLSLRQSNLKRVLKKKLELADMISIDPNSISAEYWILWVDSEQQKRLQQEANDMGIRLVIGEEILRVNGQTSTFYTWSTERHFYIGLRIVSQTRGCFSGL
uniref:Uncharacterized protein n=1 Tax=Ditylenchus dipsaci TaxID=166011 RepID=A0A915D0L0_9BILA